MSARYVVTGTDTGVGKTVFAAALTAALDGFYWKPIQSGLEEETDSETVARLSGLADNRVLPELWRLRTPASPHIAAEIDNVS
ncbi:MAG: ATP-dependent dethiobiotin synthetase BioD, partial [Rhizobiaceae bacterium]|nr:ATP-dependent dethiobiotin synthetase BioD [Rhizobiaceae bacterium]